MDQYKISTTRILSKDEQRQRLAQAYALIMSWSDPTEENIAGPENFAEDAEPAGDDETLDKDFIHDG